MSIKIRGQYAFIVLIVIGILYSREAAAQYTLTKSDGFVYKNTHFSASGDKITDELIGIYQNYISAIRGQECPMYPSCSNYCLMAFDKNSFYNGLISGCDRLLRCGHEHEYYKLTMQNGKIKYIDIPPKTFLNIDIEYGYDTYQFAYGDTLSDSLRTAFIKRLINEQYFQEALYELNKLDYNDYGLGLESIVNKVICLQALGKYEKAIYYFETDISDSLKSYPPLAFEVAKCNYFLGDYEGCGDRVQAIDYWNCNDNNIKVKYITLYGLTLLKRDSFDLASGHYELALAKYPNEKILNDNVRLMTEYRVKKQKNPTVSALLSIIPGLGYTYSGHATTGLTSLIINGLLGYATYTSIKTNNYGVAALTGILGLSFYIGNISGGYKSAVRYNNQQKLNLIEDIETNINL